VAFNNLRAEIEGKTKWEYNGETELILLSARRGPGERVRLDFNPSITCNLEAMRTAAAISSAREFFETIFRFGQKFSNSADPVFELSDRFGAEELKNFLLAAVLQLLPEKLRSSYHSAKHFAVRDISQP
jgi:hypothetical protein